MYMMKLFKTQKFKLLVKEYKNRIFSYSFLMLKNRMDADDITQEVLIRVWNNIDNFNLTSSKSYIMKIAHNLCLDYIRKNKKMAERNIEIDEYFEETYNDKSNTNNIEKKVDYNMIQEKISKIVERLPENQKTAFILSDVEGYKYKEISKIMDMPENSIKVYLLRARKKLQEELNRYEKL